MKKLKNFSKATVCDIETDGLLADVTKVHIVGYRLHGKPKTQVLWGDTEEGRIRKFLQYHIDNEIPIVGHNFITYDVPVLEKLYSIDLSELMVIDTLPLSWYLNINHTRHSIEALSSEYNVGDKFAVDQKDWTNLTKEQAVSRVTSDVAINLAIYEDFIDRLTDMYTLSKTEIDVGAVGGKRLKDGEDLHIDSLVGLSVERHIERILEFLMMKTDVQALQERTKWLVDVSLLEKGIAEFDLIINEKASILESVMPQVPKYSKRKQPAKPFKKNGDLSKSGENWENLKDLLTRGEKDEYGNLLTRVRKQGEIEELTSYNPPNINGHQQVKDFLFSHGWVPQTYEAVRDKVAFQEWINKRPEEGSKRYEWTNWMDSKPVDRLVPQVRNEDKELCESVVELAEKVPEIRALEEYSVVKHRNDTMKGILRRIGSDGKVEASWHGFTNTLRVKHQAPCANLPSADSKYSQYIRGSLVAPEGFVSCGSDLSSLESRVSHHFMLAYDKEYVETMMEDGYDPHLDVAVTAGMMTKEEEMFYKWYKDNR